MEESARLAGAKRPGAGLGRRPRVDLEDGSRLPVGEAPGPRGRPGRQLIGIELTDRRDDEAGRGITAGEITKLPGIQQWYAETGRLMQVAIGKTHDNRHS